MPTQTRSEKDQYLDALQRESAITLKLLREYPSGQDEFRPAEKSRTARELVWMFLTEEMLVSHVLKGPLQFTSAPPAPQVSVAEIAKMYESQHNDFVKQLHTAPASRFEEAIPFPVGPTKMAETPVGAIAWFMLQDHIN